MKILIEKYRGFEIYFDSQYEKFQCIITEEVSKESLSFAAVKKFVDEYKKTNQDFKPFFVEPTPLYSFKESFKIIGIRKDGRFVTENTKGEKGQLPDYHLSDYMIVKEENKELISELHKLNNEEKLLISDFSKKRKDLISKLNITTLKEYKQTL